MIDSVKKTHEELIADGYIFRKQMNCKFPACRAAILVYQNSATKKWYSMDYLTHNPHWMDCLENKKKSQARAANPKPKQGDLFF